MGPPGTPKSMKMTKPWKCMFTNSRVCVFDEKKAPAAGHLGHKKLEITTQSLNIVKKSKLKRGKPFSGSYSTVWTDSWGKFDEIATRN